MSDEPARAKPAVVWVWRLRGGAKHQYALMPPGRYSPENNTAYGEVIKRREGWAAVCGECREELPVSANRKRGVRDLITHRATHGDRLWLWSWARYAKPPRH
jgi:hypothetical protein